MLERPSERPQRRTGAITGTGIPPAGARPGTRAGNGNGGTGEYTRPRAGRTEIERMVQPSLIDRLTDAEPQSPRDPPTTPKDSAKAFRDAVQADIEWLLNTRRSIVPVPEAYRELLVSVHEFGLPDVTGIAVNTPVGRAMLRDLIQDALERFEPRLESPVVRIGEVDVLSTPMVRFQVEAILRMDPSPEHVVFDTVLEVARGEYAVEGEAGGSPNA
jgi:type VI secretion system protein ImpF